MSTPVDRPAAREAGPELLVLQRWEEFLPRLLHHTGHWPKSVRFTLAQRVENHALDVMEQLIVARYEPGKRGSTLRRINLTLERMRHLLRVAKAQGFVASTAFETTMRGIDETGRMVGGWRKSLGVRSHARRMARRGTETAP